MGISFLWEYAEDLNEVLAFNFGYRVDENLFAQYTGDAVRFENDMQELAKKALDKVKEYKKI